MSKAWEVSLLFNVEAEDELGARDEFIRFVLDKGMRALMYRVKEADDHLDLTALYVQEDQVYALAEVAEMLGIDLSKVDEDFGLDEDLLDAVAPFPYTDEGAAQLQQMLDDATSVTPAEDEPDEPDVVGDIE